MKIEFDGLKSALVFIADHGGPKEDISQFNAHTLYPEFEGVEGGAFGDACKFILLVDGSLFGVYAYSNGPLSEITPDEDFGVQLVGYTKVRN